MNPSLKSLVIKLDEDVMPTPRKSRTRAPDPRLADLQAMDVDKGKNSFFMKGAEKKEARSLITLGRKHGIFLIAREVDCDEVYQVHGTRVWRVSAEKMPKQRKADPLSPDEDF